jgi:hypothetical protein
MMKKTIAVLAALVLNVSFSVGLAPRVQADSSKFCANTSTGNTALTDLGPKTYLGEQGGLYPGGSNGPPAAYQAAGVQAAQSVIALDNSGNASASGKIGFLSIGMSNTSMEFLNFTQSEAKDGGRNPTVVFVNGAQGGKTAAYWANPALNTPTNEPWTILESRLAAAGVTDQQVEVVWLKEADYTKTLPDFQTYGRTLTQEMTQITTMAAQRFPNLRQVFVSARTYAGYSGIYPTNSATSLSGPNPEPWAYQTGFADKWFVAQSVANPSQRPWFGWGPYLWTDGTRGRADGLTWQCVDTYDGTHPDTSGLVKTTGLMKSHFLNSVFTPWFRSSAYVPPPSPSPSPIASPVASPVATPAASPAPSPVTAPGAPAGGAHPPKASAQPTPPGVNTPIGRLPEPISATVSAVSSMPAPERWSLIALVIGVLLSAIAVLMLGRRWGLPIGVRKKPRPAAGSSGNRLPTQISAEPPEPNVLVAVGSDRSPSQDPAEGGRPPTP